MILKSISYSLIFCACFLFSNSVFAQKFDLSELSKLANSKLELNLENPLVKNVIKKGIQEFLPTVTGSNEKIQDLNFKTKKKSGDMTKVKANLTFANKSAALGNGDYRVKFKIGNNLLKPKISMLKLQTFRIGFIRFYKRVI